MSPYVVEAESIQPQAGALFCALPSEPSAATTSFKGGANDYTVLLVNDSPDQLALMEQLLRAAGYRIVTAADRHEAIEVAEFYHPDLVVSDVLMPGIDGIEMCRLLRRHSQLSEVPILLVSANRK